MKARLAKRAIDEDLAERLRRAEELLRARQLDFQLLVDSIPAQVAVVATSLQCELIHTPCALLKLGNSRRAGKVLGDA